MAKGRTIARSIARLSVIVAARTRSSILLFFCSSPFFSGTYGASSVERDAPLSVYGLEYSVTTIVAVGSSRYSVPFFALG